MKKIKTIIILIIIAFSFQLITSPAIAQNDPPESLNFIPQITIPGSNFEEGQESIVGQSYTETNQETSREKTVMSSTLLPRYIKAIYQYGIGISSFLALIMIVAGGLIWLTSAGSPDKIGKAKSIIASSIIGLVLLLGTYTMLQFVNPDLLNFKPIKTEYIGVVQLGCCEFTDEEENSRAKNLSSKDCEGEEYQGAFFPEASPNQNKDKCLKNGCCVLTNSDMHGGFVTECVDGNSEFCNLIVNQDDNILIRDSEFVELSCGSLPQEDYNCERNEKYCEDSDDGDICTSANDNCYCYNQSPTFGPGQEGEICGNEDGSKCYTDKPDDHGNITYDRDLVGGRNCDDGLKCYHPEFKD